MASRQSLIRNYSAALASGTASAFIGAGLSVAAGYPTWRELLREIADDLHLDIDAESDLAAVAQFHLNQHNQTSAVLTRTITDNFERELPLTNNHKILARLPVRRIWTTNYDRLIEQSWREAARPLDVKTRNDDLTTPSRTASTVLYKMHGTVEHPADVVIAKDHYEVYSRDRETFQRLLFSDLVTTTFLFLGLSFTDPNIGLTLAMIRAAYGSRVGLHYTILRPPQPAEYPTTPAYDYAVIRYELWRDDLLRYGIHAIEITDYDEITTILREMEQAVARKSVLVSGSISGAPQHLAVTSQAAHAVGRTLSNRGTRLVSGLGVGVGRTVLAAFLESEYSRGAPSLDERLFLRPFPETDEQGLVESYRLSMVATAGTCIVINGLRSGQVASGVLQEVDFAVAQDRYILPLAYTGGAAGVAYAKLIAEHYRPLVDLPRNHHRVLTEAPESEDILMQRLNDVFDELKIGRRNAARN